jgi:hypothetical protein
MTVEYSFVVNVFHRCVVAKTAIKREDRKNNKFRPTGNTLLFIISETVLGERIHAFRAQRPDSLLPCRAKISLNAIGPSLPQLYTSRQSTWKIIRYL